MPILTNFQTWLKKFPSGKGKHYKSVVLLSSEYKKSHPKTYEMVIELMRLAFEAGQHQYWREQRKESDWNETEP